MNDNNVDLEVIARWRGGQSQRGIARDLGVCRKRVRRIIEQHQQDRHEGTPPAGTAAQAASPQPIGRVPREDRGLVDALSQSSPPCDCWRNFGETAIKAATASSATGCDNFALEPKQQPVIRFETSPGLQAQMDYAVRTTSSSLMKVGGE